VTGDCPLIRDAPMIPTARCPRSPGQGHSQRKVVEMTGAIRGLDGTRLDELGSGNVQAGDTAGNHQPLDLGRAFEDRVAHYVSYGQCAHVR
jgi:hypothetical protein